MDVIFAGRRWPVLVWPGVLTTFPRPAGRAPSQMCARLALAARAGGCCHSLSPRAGPSSRRG